jgi:hypothetical protein
MVLAVLCVMQSGCTVYYNARRTLITEPRLFNWKADHVKSLKLYEEWAEAAWIETGLGAGGCADPNFAWGFRSGFVEYVYAGGNGEPPAAPPRELWKAGWRTAEGKAAADAWFAGFRQGAAVAREGGYREQAVLRTDIGVGMHHLTHVGDTLYLPQGVAIDATSLPKSAPAEGLEAIAPGELLEPTPADLRQEGTPNREPDLPNLRDSSHSLPPVLPSPAARSDMAAVPAAHLEAGTSGRVDVGARFGTNDPSTPWPLRPGQSIRLPEQEVEFFDGRGQSSDF